MRNKGRPLWLLSFGKWFYFGLVVLVLSFTYIFESLARTLSPATSRHRRLCCCFCCCSTAVLLFVLLLWCACGGFDSGAVLLSRLCEDEALPRTLQARYAVVGVFVILCCG